MNKQRVLELFDIYGAHPESWPAEERAAAEVLLASSSELQQSQKTALVLDEYLDLDRQQADISQHQAEALTKKTLRLVAGEPKLKPPLFKHLLRNLISPRYAIAFSALFAIIVVVNVTIKPQTEEDYASTEFDNWMLTQLTGVVADDNDIEDLGFIDLVELESKMDSTI